MADTAQRLLLVDDEPLARQRLRDLVSDLGAYQVVAEATNGVEALEALQANTVDIALVDIRMPLMDGIELAQHLQRLPQPPRLIFTTAYDHYAVQAFELNALDYLLKPIRRERLAAALAKAQPLLASQVHALQALPQSRTHFSIHMRGKVVLVPVAEVLYLRAELKYITVRTRDHSYLLEDSLSQLETQYAAQFVRIHRNALVARAAIVGFEKQRPAPANEGAVRADEEAVWVVRLKDVPETLVVSRRHQHLIRTA